MRLVGSVTLVLSLLTGVLGCGAQEAPSSKAQSPEKRDEAVAPPELSMKDPTSEWTVEAGSAEARLLRFKPAQQRTYAMELTQKASRLGHEPPLATEVTQSMTMARTLVEPGTETWTEEVRFSNMKLVPNKADKDRIAPEALGRTIDMMSRLKVRLTSNPLGEVLSIDVRGAAGSTDMLASMLEQMMKDASFPLPEQAVKPGDRWTVKRTASIKRTKTENEVVYDLQGEYLGQVTMDGLCSPCDVLRLSGPFQLTGELDAKKMSGKTRGAGQTRLVVLLDNATGSLVQSTVQTVMEQQFDVKKDGQGLTLVERQEMSLTQTLLPATVEEAPKQNKEKK